MPALRPITDDDHDFVLALNTADVTLLAPMDDARLRRLRDLADTADIITFEGRPAGFVLTFAPGAAYDSANYRWFSANYDDFIYLDRIVLHRDFRRRGLGTFAYDALEEAAIARGRFLLEVNLDPPNEPSLAFHAGRGYRPVAQRGEPGHVVQMMSKDLGRVARATSASG